MRPGKRERAAIQERAKIRLAVDARAALVPETKGRPRGSFDSFSPAGNGHYQSCGWSSANARAVAVERRRKGS